MRGQRDDAAFGLQNGGRDVLPIPRSGDIRVDDVVHRHRHRRDRPPGIDEASAAFVCHGPLPVSAKRDVLPANFAHAVRRGTRASGFQIDDAHAKRHDWNIGASPRHPIAAASTSEGRVELAAHLMRGSPG